jgi:DNA helicase-2/ATP-dependent DNA helicase PcrA
MIITSKDKICIEEDFKIEAGPGAGKTEFLVNHIKNVLQNSTRLSCARKVACITYTNTAVETILKRIGKGVSNQVEVSTIHSFLYRNVVKPYCSFIPPEYELSISKIKGHEEFYISNTYIREWLEDDSFDTLSHPNARKQILKLPICNQALRNWLTSMRCIYKNNDVSFECDNIKAIGYGEAKNSVVRISDDNLKILSEEIIGLKKIYWRKGGLSHEDVLFFSFALIKKYPFILEVLRSKFPYMFIDEYQDTNPIQSYILNEIRKKDTVVGVIGDKAQSIYKFQGADPSLFDSFEVNENNVYTINDNHRSTNQIVQFLNNIRGDISQNLCKNIDDIEPIIYVGNRNDAYSKAYELCCGETVVSLSRDNISSNAMKKVIEGNNVNRKLLERFLEKDGTGKRRASIVAFIQSIELAVNGRYKEAIKNIEWIFRDEDNPRKTALFSLTTMLKIYNEYCDDTLMKFYQLISSKLNINLSGFREGAAKDFYENTLYKNLAICINIVEDISNHITIHKAKGAEYENVILIDNKDIKDFLLNPDLHNNEEHRIIYVAMSRARRRLFIQMEELSDMEEKRVFEKFSYLSIERL